MTDKQLMSREKIEQHLSGIEKMLATSGGGVMYIDPFELERICFAALGNYDKAIEDAAVTAYRFQIEAGSGFLVAQRVSNRIRKLKGTSNA